MTTSESAVDDLGQPMDRSRRRIPRLAIVLGAAFGVLIVDQGTKYLATQSLEPGEPVQVIGSLLQLALVRNAGAAFSLGTGFTVLLSAMAIIMVVIIARFATRIGSVWWAVALGGLLGGALGNLTDRIFRPPGVLRGQVIDFIQLPHWPVFNVADSAIVVSAIIMVVLAFRGVAMSDQTGGGPS